MDWRGIDEVLALQLDLAENAGAPSVENLACSLQERRFLHNRCSGGMRDPDAPSSNNIVIVIGEPRGDTDREAAASTLRAVLDHVAAFDHCCDPPC